MRVDIATYYNLINYGNMSCDLFVLCQCGTWWHGSFLPLSQVTSLVWELLHQPQVWESSQVWDLSTRQQLVCCVCTHEGYKGRSLLVAQGKRKILAELNLLLVSKNLVTKPDVSSGYFNPPSDTVLNKCHSPPTHILHSALCIVISPESSGEWKSCVKKG